MQCICFVSARTWLNLTGREFNQPQWLGPISQPRQPSKSLKPHLHCLKNKAWKANASRNYPHLSSWWQYTKNHSTDRFLLYFFTFFYIYGVKSCTPMALMNKRVNTVNRLRIQAYFFMEVFLYGAQLISRNIFSLLSLFSLSQVIDLSSSISRYRPTTCKSHLYSDSQGSLSERNDADGGLKAGDCDQECEKEREEYERQVKIFAAVRTRLASAITTICHRTDACSSGWT